VIRVFAFVTLASMKNRIWSRLKRLREPRYLVSAIAGLAYMVFWLSRSWARQPPNARIVFLGLGADVASIVVLAMMIGAWALPGDQGGLEFSEPEIQFLFPAPLTRRQLLLYKIMRMQVPALFSSVMLSIFGLRRSNFVGVWLAFGVLSIYFLMTALGRARLKLAGIGFVTRVIVVVLTFAALSWFLSVEFSQSGIGASLRASRPRDPFRTISTIDVPFHRPAVAAILFVPRLFAATAFSTSVLQFLTYASAVLVLGAVFFLIATNLNISFEEASIVASQSRFERKERMKDRQAGRWVAFKRFPPPFNLRPHYGPFVAIFWKNLIAALRISSAWTLVIAAPFLVIALKTLGGGPFFSNGTAVLCLVMCAAIPLVAPDIFRQDLRYDLAQADLLKSLPISGERLVAAEMAAPLLIVSVIELVLLLFATITLQIANSARLVFFASPNFIVVAMLFAIPVCAAQLLIRNAVAVFFPAWAVRSKDDVRGFVATGQRLIVLVGNLLVLAALLVPAGILFLPALWAAYRFFGGSALVLAISTIPSAALSIAQVWFGIHLVGEQFDRLDASNEIQV